VNDLDVQHLIHAMWRKKDLSYLFHEDQEYVYGQWKARMPRKWYLNCSRRWGKSFFKSVVAAQTALEVDYAEIRYAAPTQKQARNIVEPHFRRIFRDAPDDLRPDFRAQDQVWRFPNGSTIILAGVDNGGAERLRGTSTHLALIDEAGLMEDLDYIIQDILLPQTITVDGRLLISSTPPRTPAHPYKQHCLAAMITGNYIKRTIYDAPHITQQMVEEYAQESGGMESTTFKREYLAEFVTDESSVIIPEWVGVRKECLIDDSYTLPPYFFTWVVSDVGYTDLTVIGFFFVDFLQAKLVLWDEVVLTRTKSSDINDIVVARLEKWGWTGVVWPQQFIADTLSKNTIHDMSDRRIQWGPPFKQNPDAALNALRVFISGKNLWVHPRCEVTISHLDNGVWNKARTSFERSDEFGHFDAIDMLKYAVRSIDRTMNPFPEDTPPSLDTHFYRGKMRGRVDPAAEILGGTRGRR
jgi:hypothetical protein